MAKKNEKDSVALDNATGSSITPEEFLGSYREANEGGNPSFGEWYSFMDSHNKTVGLSDVTFKQWYAFKRCLVDQTKPFHPEWSVLGSKKCKSPMHDINLESPEDEYKRLLNEYFTEKEES